MNDALESLSQRRKAERDRALEELAHRRRELSALDEALAALRERGAKLDRALHEARTSARTARDVVSLRWSEAHLRALCAERAELDARLEALVGQRTSVSDDVRAAEASLLAHEVGRRAVDRTLERRADARAKAEERRAEDEAEDTHRARRRS